MDWGGEARWVKRVEEWGLTDNGYGVYLLGNRNVFELDSGDVARLCEYTKSNWIVNFLNVNFMVCELYFNNKSSFSEWLFWGSIRVLVPLFLTDTWYYLTLKFFPFFWLEKVFHCSFTLNFSDHYEFFILFIRR